MLIHVSELPFGRSALGARLGAPKNQRRRIPIHNVRGVARSIDPSTAPVAIVSSNKCPSSMLQ